MYSNVLIVMRNMPVRSAIFLALLLSSATITAISARADGDAGVGQDLFYTCAACHEVGNGARNRVGPVLNDIVGRRAATRDGYAYSRAMKEKGAEGLVWTPESLDAYLANPRVFVRGTRMAYAGLRDAERRSDLIAYLKTLTFESPAQSKILK